jgi:hypothetical protein
VEIAEAADLPARLENALVKAPLRPQALGELPEALRGTLDRTLALIAPHLPLPLA